MRRSKHNKYLREFESLISEDEFNHSKLVKNIFIIDKKVNNSKVQFQKLKKIYDQAKILEKKKLYKLLKDEIKKLNF